MPNYPEAILYRGYLWTTALVSFMVLAAIGALNYLIDPYFIHQWDSDLLMRSSPAQQKFTPWAKSYAAYRYRPEVVFLGSSRTEIGLPADATIFPGKRVFNLALKGGKIGDAVDMLRHTDFFYHPEVVVWGLECGWLFSDDIGNTDFDRDLVATGSFYPLKRTVLNVKRSLALDMTKDSFAILMGVSEQSCPPILATYGHKAPQCVERLMQQEGGTAKAFAELVEKSKPLSLPETFTDSFTQVGMVTNELCQQGTIFRFYIQPVHALAELQWADHWPQMENWKRAVVQMVDGLKQQGCDARLVDFSGFNSVTTEDIPQVTGKETMQYYWEQSHYRSEVGKMILWRLFSPTQAPLPEDFGVELDGGMIEGHLAGIRRARDSYCATHPLETKHLQRLVTKQTP